MSARPWVLVPAKGFARAKSRLASVLDVGEREQLARSLLEHVLGVAQRSDAVAGVMVVTDCARVARVARLGGAVVSVDAAPTLAGVVDGALEALAQRGASHAIVLMSDLPFLEAGDVADLARAVKEADVVVSPDRHGQGTNALALSLASPMPTCFGNADSYVRHLARARSLGLTVATHMSERLGFDVDAPSDIASLRNRKRPSPVSAA